MRNAIEPGMWMNEYVRLIQVILNWFCMKKHWICSSKNMCSFSSAAITCRACFRAANTVPSTIHTAVAARPSW